MYAPGTSVSSVRPRHNTRNLCEFCNTSVPVPETSGSTVRLPYPYPECTNPTEHNLVIFSFSRSPSHVILLFFRAWLLLRHNSRASSFSLYDRHERCFCVWACEYACVCARSEQRDTVVRKPLYPYVAHHGKFWNIYGSARGVNCNNCDKSFQFFTPLAAAVFKYNNSSSRQKG